MGMVKMLEQLCKLQNGSDIRGIAIKSQGNEVSLTTDMVKQIGVGFVKQLEKKVNANFKPLKIAVGMDSRLSGPVLKSSLIESLIENGCIVYDCGMGTTPAMFMTTLPEIYDCDGAIMITASHLPYYYNGLKFFTKDGGCENEDINEIITIAATSDKIYPTKSGDVLKVNLLQDYSSFLTEMIIKSVKSDRNYNKPLEGLKIIVDAGNGAGGFFSDKVLKQLGADITGSQFTEPDGRFPNHIPNPEVKEAMESIRRAVLLNKADLGIIFDADVDRVAIVDSEGNVINKNALIALISAIVLEECPMSTIVTDSVTSTGLSEFINKLGGVHHRFKRGYRNVINEAKRLNSKGVECCLAIETSGHAALKENYFLDDGAYLAAKILIKMSKLNSEGRHIQSLIKDLKSPQESNDIRIKINTQDFRNYGSNIIDELKEYTSSVNGWSIVPKNYEGLKVTCCKNDGDGWFLLRQSLHEPVLALNLESDSKGGTDIILKKLMAFLNKFSDLAL
jgi:phosphomannomutase